MLIKKRNVAQKKNSAGRRASNRSAKKMLKEIKTDQEPKQKGISRIDSNDTHGWFVRVYNQTITYSKLFSDLKCGGREVALSNAISFRDDLIQEIGKTYPARRIVRRDKRNKTGVIGVCRTRKKNRNGTYSEYFSVSWSPEFGVHKCRMFSVNKHGDAKAFKLACDWRKKMEKKIHGQTWVNKPQKTPKYKIAK
ncbi:MAG: AP2 domain-containing protein [SAR324 cluster bacterium]|nr:AP2 domain-containing protein [SAR324 cluster bacterium]